MSKDLLLLALDYEGKLTGSEKLVLLYLCNLSNDDRGKYAWPSHRYLSRKTGLSLATVKRACKSLKEKNFITWVKSKYVDGKFKTNHYTINHSSLRAVVNSNQVSKRTLLKDQSDTPVSVIVSDNNLTNNLYYKLEKIDEIFNEKESKLSEKQRSLAQNWTEKYIKAETQYIETKRVYSYVVVWLALGQTQKLWDKFGTFLKSPIDKGWSKGTS